MLADQREDEGSRRHDFDLIAIAVNSLWAPHLETACEICLREVEMGRRVAFIFLDIDNVDEFPQDAASPTLGALGYAASRRYRMARVRKIETILRERGVTVIPAVSSRARLSCDQVGIDSISSLREFRLGGARLGLGTLSSLIFRLGDSDPDFAASRPLIDRLLTSAYQAFELTREVIQRYRPARVLVFNGRFACVKAISEAARTEEVEVWYHESVSSHERYFSAPRPVHSARTTRAHLHSSWESAGDNREAIAQSFFSPDRTGLDLIEIGYRDTQVAGHSVPATGRRRIVYFASSIDEYAAVEDGLDHPLFASQHLAVAWLAAWVRERSDVELIIRVHPRMRRLSAREHRWWNSHTAENVTTLNADNPVDSYALARSADRVVTYHSTMGAEATYLGKVSILVGDADYRGLDCVYEPGSLPELESMLVDDSLLPKPRENCLPFGYQRLMRGEPFRFYQPRSTDRGAFFGEEITTPWDGLPLRNRVGRRAVHKLNSLVQLVRSEPAKRIR